MKNVKYGKCVRCGRTYEAKPELTNCECGGILDIVYDYDYIKSVLTKEKLARRENRSMWRNITGNICISLLLNDF